MARQPMVSRTVKICHCTVLCLNLEEKAPFTQVIDITRPPKNSEKLLKRIKSIVDNEKQIAVCVESMKEEPAIIVMSEQEFIERGRRVTKRT